MTICLSRIELCYDFGFLGGRLYETGRNSAAVNASYMAFFLFSVAGLVRHDPRRRGDELH